MIVITGANGRLGGAVVERLLDRVPADGIGVSVRDPAAAAGLAARGVRVRRGDFDDPGTLADAVEGAEQVLVVSSATSGEAALLQHRAAFDAAIAAGARRVLYTSHMGSSATSAFPPMVDHAASEAMLAASGTAFTSLRNGFYTASGLMLLGQALETGEVAAPEDGPVSWTAHADLADAAAITLVDGGFDGVTPALTGSEALDLAGIARIASELTGRTITRTVVPDGRYRDGLLARGTPEPVADMVVGLFVAARRGEFAAVDPTLEKLLGRPPLTVRDVLRERLRAG